MTFTPNKARPSTQTTMLLGPRLPTSNHHFFGGSGSVKMCKNGKTDWGHRGYIPVLSVYIYIYMYTPRAQTTSMFEGQPSKTRPFPTKTRVIWVQCIIHVYTYMYICVYLYAIVYIGISRLYKRWTFFNIWMIYHIYIICSNNVKTIYIYKVNVYLYT